MPLSVQWRPSPNFNARDSRYPLRGDVSHRIVGSAPSALGTFGAPGGIPGMAPRSASSHFIIGHRNGRGPNGEVIADAPCPECGPITGAKGPLVIYQCVDLANMAWTNGDVRDPTWPGYQPGVNPNLTTITTEHEDMAAAGRHIVTDHIWRASMELKRLLRSGDLAAIRATGVRVSDGAFKAAVLVQQLAAFPISNAAYTDHHAISGPNKPWCWRDYDGDKGFPSRLPGLLAYLKGQDMINDYLKGATFTPNKSARIAQGATARRIPAFDRNDYDANRLFTLASASAAPAIAWVKGTNLTLVDGTEFDARTDWLAVLNRDHGIVFFHVRDVAELVAIEAGSDCTAQEAMIATQTQRIADLQTALGSRDVAIAKKNTALDSAIAHEKPHVDVHSALVSARKA